MTHFISDKMVTHTLVGDGGEVHVFWHNYRKPLYMYLGAYDISILKNTDLNVFNENNEIMVQGGDNYSFMKALKTPDGKFSFERLKPREGWNHTHLFGGLGAFPSWKSNELIKPHKPVIIYVNGTRDRKPKYKDIVVNSEDGVLKIFFEEKWYTIETPFY